MAQTASINHQVIVMEVLDQNLHVDWEGTMASAATVILANQIADQAWAAMIEANLSIFSSVPSILRAWLHTPSFCPYQLV